MTVQLLEFVPDVIVTDLVFEVVEGFRFGHVAHGPPFRIAGNAVVSASLYVHRRQIQRHGVRRREQMIDQLVVQILFGRFPLGGHREESAHQRVRAPFVGQTPRCEKRFAQRQVTLA